MSKTLLHEIKNIALCVLVLGAIQILITIPVGYFGTPVVLGTLLGCGVALLNFTLMGVILEKSMSRGKAASGMMSVGYMLRLAIIAAAVIWGIKAAYLNYLCVIIPLIFPQIGIFIINALRKKERKADDNERT